MNTHHSSGIGDVQFPEPVINSRKLQISIVWLIPLIAAFIGGWLIYRALSERGPEITITFRTAEGLEAGKTKIKYKEVEIGTVTELTFTEDHSKVLVKAKCVKGSETFLTENTRFWVVRPRIAVQGVSGLGTLFSGAYIDVDPGTPGKPQYNFMGLEDPPLISAVDPGRRFLLKADRRGSIEIGSPVYYRQIVVGKVISFSLTPDGSNIFFNVFINAPFHQYVYKNTRFWNTSGLDLKLDAVGFRIMTESFLSMLVGGIAFDIVDTYEIPNEAPGEDESFVLYSSRDEAQKKEFSEKKLFLLNFNASVRGLSPGAPVEFRGIQIGEVLDLKLEYDNANKIFEVPVLIVIEPGRFNMKKDTNWKEKQNVIDYLVEKGLRAQLLTGNFVTGQKFISLDFFPEAAKAMITHGGAYPVIPTLPTQIEEIGSKVSRLITKLEKLPIDQIGDDLRHAIKGVRQIANSSEIMEAINSLNSAIREVQLLTEQLRTKTTHEVSDVIKQANLSLAASQAVLEADSPAQYRLKEMLDEITDVARSLKELAEYLDKHPESILRGKGYE